MHTHILVYDATNDQFYILSDLGSYYLPFLYSCVSFLGVLLLLGENKYRKMIYVLASAYNTDQCKIIFFSSVCTPLGFVRLFGVVSQVLVKPHLLRDVDEEYHAFYLEEASVKRKLENVDKGRCIPPTLPMHYSNGQNGHYTAIANGKITPTLSSPSFPTKIVSLAESFLNHRHNGKSHNNHAYGMFYSEFEKERLHERLRELESERKELDKLRSSTPLQRNLMYPLAMLLLLVITGITVLTVVMNSMELLIGIKALPLSTRVRWPIHTA